MNDFQSFLEEKIFQERITRFFPEALKSLLEPTTGKYFLFSSFVTIKTADSLLYLRCQLKRRGKAGETIKIRATRERERERNKRVEMDIGKISIDPKGSIAANWIGVNVGVKDSLVNFKASDSHYVKDSLILSWYQGILLLAWGFLVSC